MWGVSCSRVRVQSNLKQYWPQDCIVGTNGQVLLVVSVQFDTPYLSQTYLASLRRGERIMWFKCTKLAGQMFASANFTAKENLSRLDKFRDR